MGFQSLNPVEIKNNLVFHNLRKPDTLAKFLARGDKFFEVMKNFDAIIVRCNPGQIKADGGSQETFDDAMRAIKKSGVQAPCNW